MQLKRPLMEQAEKKKRSEKISNIKQIQLENMTAFGVWHAYQFVLLKLF